MKPAEAMPLPLGSDDDCERSRGEQRQRFAGWYAWKVPASGLNDADAIEARAGTMHCHFV